MSLASIIAIDGPAGSGKSTVGQKLALRLGYLYFDTGVMYRAVTLAALERGVPIADEAAVTRLAHDLVIDVCPPSVQNRDDGRLCTVLADGQDVTWAIRRPDVDRNVSPVAAVSGVRAALTPQQRRVGLRGRVVMVGRDVATVILPEAQCKIYLDATLEERTRRRVLEQRAAGRGSEPTADFEAVMAVLRRRDEIDSTRATAPLRRAPDAVHIDSTHLTSDQVVAQVLQLAAR